MWLAREKAQHQVLVEENLFRRALVLSPSLLFRQPIIWAGLIIQENGEACFGRVLSTPSL